MSAYFATSDRVSAGVALAASATIAFASGKPIDVKRVVLVTTTANAGTKTMTFGVRNVDDTGSTTIGTFVVPISVLNATTKADVAGVDPDVLTTDGGGISQQAEVTTGRVVGRLSNQPGVIEVNPGQEFFLTSDAGAGAFAAYIEYEEMGNNADRFEPAVAVVTYS